MIETPILNFGNVSAHSSWMKVHMANMELFSSASPESKEEMLVAWHEGSKASYFELKSNIANYVTLGNRVEEKDILSASKQGSKSTGVVMVIPIKGMMIKEEWNYWGVTSTKRVRRLIASANANPGIVAVVLAFDSGGGMVDGNYVLCEDVANSSTEIWGHIEGICGSAAFQVAAQCKKLFMDSPTDFAGSIGVFQTHVSHQGFLESIGTKYSYIVADGGPNKVVAPYTHDLEEDDIVKIKAEINPLRELMVAQIKNGRKGAIKANSETFTGSIFNLKESKSQGLIDGRASLDKTIINAFRAGSKRRKDKVKSNQEDTTNFSLTNNPTNQMAEETTYANSDGFFKRLGATLGITNNAAPTPEPIKLSGEDQNKVNATIATLKNKITALEAEKATALGEVETLKTTVAEQKISIDTLQAKIDTPEAGDEVVTPLLSNEEIQTLQASVTTLEGEKVALEADKVALETEKTAFEDKSKKLAVAYNKVKGANSLSISDITGDESDQGAEGNQGDAGKGGKDDKEYGNLSQYHNIGAGAQWN